MNCEHVRECLSAYLDSQLAMHDREMIALHLHECMACSEILTDFCRFDILIAQLPRVAPDRVLHEKIFSSAEYREMTGTGGVAARHYRATRRQPVPHLRLLKQPDEPANSFQKTPPVIRTTVQRARLPRLRGRLLLLALLLLVLTLSGLVGWQWRLLPLFMTQAPVGYDAGERLPLATNVLPEDTRVVFVRDGTLWSVSSTQPAESVRLASEALVAPGWAVRPPLPGRTTGNMLAYIDLAQGSVHILQGHDLRDITVPQPLLLPGLTPETIWETTAGATILNSLAWSYDGSMLAFVASSLRSDETSLFIYDLHTTKVQKVSLPSTGIVARPIWSPDSKRLAFTLTSEEQVHIFEYHVENHGYLPVATLSDPQTTLFSFGWSPDIQLPALTWSTGRDGRVQQIWWKAVGVDLTVEPRRLAEGIYTQALYHGQRGNWLMVADSPVAKHLFVLDLTAQAHILVQRQSVTFARWSPDGSAISYQSSQSGDPETLWVINVTTGRPTKIATNVASSPLPTWSPDSKRLVYSTGTQILVTDVQQMAPPQTIPLDGTAISFCWAFTNPALLALAIGEVKPGMYLVDARTGASLQLDQLTTRSPLFWMQFS